ncbi:MAG: hypothetical protein ABWX96_13235 [Propionibacteriaceae bacterium]
MTTVQFQRRRRRSALLVVVLVSALAGCGTPPWKTDASPTPAARSSAKTVSATPKPTVAPSVTPSAAEPVQNDLATGSAKRRLEAGGVRIKVNYWSTLDMADWTQNALKPLNLSASAAFIDGSEQDIFLSKVSVNMSVAGAKGALTSPDALVDASTVTPGYLITSPSSYGQVFTVPALAAGATSVTLTLTYELLVQSAPKAKTYSKQTASNDLVIPIQS